MEKQFRIMIVDESQTVAMITSKLLEYQHWEVVQATNGEIALNILQKENISAILMDINLPGMTGIECCQEIRKMDDRKKAKLPIFAVTGNDLELSRESYISFGFDELFLKPTNFQLLIEKLNYFFR